jgi:hypothetical protein
MNPKYYTKLPDASSAAMLCHRLIIIVVMYALFMPFFGPMLDHLQVPLQGFLQPFLQSLSWAVPQPAGPATAWLLPYHEGPLGAPGLDDQIMGVHQQVPFPSLVAPRPPLSVVFID